MEHATFTERTRASLREQLLEAATALLPDRGYGGLRMADVAAKVGVSRQTVYNEFGGKAALVQAVSLRTASEFLDGIGARLAAAGDLPSAVEAATTYTIEHARENRLVAAALGTEAGEDLLPLLTTRGEPILHAAAELAAADLRERCPGLAERAVDLIAETMTRLTLSHLVLRTHTAAEAAHAVRVAITSMVEHHSATSPATERARP